MAWYLRDNPQAEDMFLSSNYMRMDGTNPKYGELLNEICQNCGEIVRDPHQLVRVSKEKK